MPDFRIGEFQGIPDEFDGAVVTKTATTTYNMPAFTASKDAYIIQLPVPGVAYFYGQITAGVLVLTPVLWSEGQTLFPVGFEGTNFSKFRFAGSALEVVPTVNAMTWAGSVQVWRGPVNLSMTTTVAPATVYNIVGLSELITSLKPEAVHPFNMGCYCNSRPTDLEFPWQPILTGLSGASEVTFDSTSTISITTSGWGINFVGLGAMEAVVYKIPNFSTTANAGVIRTWQALEFQVSSLSALYEYAHISPPHDPVALALLRRVLNEVDVCVPFYENDGVWSKVLAYIRKYASLLSHVPGEVGTIATGVSMVASGLEAITL